MDASTDELTPLSAAPAWRGVGMGVVLALLAIGVYAVSLRSSFVYDATTQIQEDDYIHTPANLIDVITFRVMSKDVLDFNRPVHLLSLMVDSLVWGRNPVGFHLTNLLLHAASTVLLYGILWRWLAEDEVGWPTVWAALAAGVFAVHPVGTEAVAEPSYREDVLSAFFLLAALALAGRWSGSWRGRAWIPAAGVLLCVLGAVGSKEIGVAVVPVLAMFAWLRRRSAPRKAWLTLLGFGAAITAAFVVARFALEPTNSHVFNVKATYLGGSLGAAMQIQPRIWLLYLLHLVWPSGLCADYGAYNLPHLSAAAAWGVVAGVVLVQLLAAWRSRLMALSAGVFWLTLLPASNLFPMFRPAADRYCYTPMIGIAFAVAAVLAGLSRVRGLRGIVVTVMGIMLAALATVCVQRQAVFASSLALWSDTIAQNPTSSTAADNFGWAHLTAGELPAALDAFRRAVNMTHGQDPDPFAGAALAWEASGRPILAEGALTQAIKLNPAYHDPAQLRQMMSLTRKQAEQLTPILKRVVASGG